MRIWLLRGLFLFMAGFCAPALSAPEADQDKMIEKALMEYQRGNTPNALI
ncbi:MAG: hypothetical protein ABII20_00105 [Candidatus Omnitrophota bacterium]